jgi:long-chain acyl-CoA synthetase
MSAPERSPHGKESAIVAAVRAAASRRASHAALMAGEQRISYGELERRSAAVAAQVAANVSGPVVGILLPTIPSFAWAFLGALWAGKTVAVLPTLAPPPLLQLMAAGAGLTTVLTSPELAPRAAEAHLTAAIVDLVPRRAGTEPPLAPRALDAAVLLYTSGTTGRPKAVALSDENILANAEGCRIAQNFTADDVMMGILPLFHAFGLTVNLVLPLSLGGSVFLEERFAPRTVLEDIARHRTTTMVAVPSQFRLLAKESAKTDYGSMRLSIAGAERLTEQVHRDFEQRFGKTLLEGYGATEASPVVAINPPHANRAGSVGVPLPNLRVTIREEDRALGSGEEGEICVEGPSVMLGYFNQPEATAQRIPGGVLRTGDRGRLDRDGYLRITGRADDMLKVAGEKIYPTEIERAIEQVDGVEQAVVVGAPDATHGLALHAFVEPRPGAQISEAQLRAATRERIEAAKLPRSFTVMEQLPRTPGGKVDKRALLERVTQTQP